jgi:hypothetical protein
MQISFKITKLKCLTFFTSVTSRLTYDKVRHGWNLNEDLRKQILAFGAWKSINPIMQISLNITKLKYFTFFHLNHIQTTLPTKYDMDKISIKIRENKFEPLKHGKAWTWICKLVLRSQNWNSSLSFTSITSRLPYDKVRHG